MAGEQVEEEALLCLDRITCMKLKEFVSKEDMDSIYNQFIDLLKKEMVLKIPKVENMSCNRYNKSKAMCLTLYDL